MRVKEISLRKIHSLMRNREGPSSGKGENRGGVETGRQNPETWRIA